VTNEKRLEIERRIIRRYLKALVDTGYEIAVDYEQEDLTWHRDVQLGLEEVTAVDIATVYCREPGAKTTKGWLYFVQGNEPGEVLNDYTTNLEEVLAPVNAYAEEWA
jgi:hypothetical protein